MTSNSWNNRRRCCDQMERSARPAYNYPHRHRNSERTSNRLAELDRKFGSTMTKYNLRGNENIFNGKRAAAATTSALDRHVHVPKLQKLSPREMARRDIAAMGKTVEISDGTGDFDRLMAAEFGKGFDERSWKFAKDVFGDSTGLRLIKEEDY